jgi:hypothetical protein
MSLLEKLESVLRPASGISYFYIFVNFELERPPAPTCPFQRKWNRFVVRQAQSLFLFFFFYFELERPSRRDLSLSEKMESVRRPAGAISFVIFFLILSSSGPPAPTCPRNSIINRCVVRQAQSLYYFYFNFELVRPPAPTCPRERKFNRCVLCQGQIIFFYFHFIFFLF